MHLYTLYKSISRPLMAGLQRDIGAERVVVYLCNSLERLKESLACCTHSHMYTAAAAAAGPFCC